MKDDSSYLQFVKSSFRIFLCTDDEKLQKKFCIALRPFGYNISLFKNGKEVFENISNFSPDLIISDIKLKEMNGFELLKAVKTNLLLSDIPFMLVLNNMGEDEIIRVLQMGADDVLRYPFLEAEFRARVRALLRIRTYQQRLQNEKKILEVRLKERTKEIHEITLGLIAALEVTTEMKDFDAKGHIKRVSIYSEILAEEMGFNQEYVEKIFIFAPMHDIGKVGIPDNILKKDGVLTKKEFDIMKRHTIYGYEILTAAKLDEIASNISLYHHERTDGSGYPYGVKDKMIPIEARIVSLADVYDALTTRRRYKEPISHFEAKEFILHEQKHIFDPEVLIAFLKREKQFRSVKEEI